MEPAQQFKARHPMEIEDLVAQFVENQLGRLDWASNWGAWKVQYPNYLDRIRNFFHKLGETVDPKEIADHIDRMILTRPGRWR